MKGIGFKLRKVHVFGLSVLLLAGVALVADVTAQQEGEEWCYLMGFHQYQINGGSTFTSASEESITANADGQRFTDRNGLSTLPVKVLGMAGRGYTEGVGETMYWVDKSRPVKGSGFRAKTAGAAFPAVHEMHFHLRLTTDTFPGRTFQSINPAVMVNNNAMSFPPKVGSRYVLKQPVEFEDIDNPGETVLSIVSNRNEMIGSGRWNQGRRAREN